MASSFHNLIFAFLFLLPHVFAAKNSGESENARLTHLHFYLHDTLSGPRPSAVRVAGLSPKNATATTSLGFGDIVVIDDPLTEGPSISSALVGRAQGFYVHASTEGIALEMVVNLVLLRGEYNGSTLVVVGRNAVLEMTREFAVVGGSGSFRLARGWVVDKTYAVDPKTGDGIFEFDVYVQH
ncbi:dirigent protein 22-like [Ananas comosus]|uniref:Dirigent protein n=1 Tax=Ananas comosus TaxID=4615 RepID=A0A6P5H2E2_ANACO|nr:dirigent protein 22-like [Ananas comosus]